MSLMRSFVTVSSLTLLSRVFGLARDILMAAVIGAGWQADCFFVAFKFPNLFRRLFAEGAFSAAFVPLFADQLGGAGNEREALTLRARRFAEETLSVLLSALILLVALFQIFMPWLILLIAPGFADDPAKYDLATALARLTFPYLLFISLVAFLGAMMNSLGRFAAFAAAPILLNVVFIAALLFFTDRTQTPVHALAAAVTVGGIIQFVLLLRAADSAGLRPRLRLPRLTPRVRKLLGLMAPGMIGAGVMQLNTLIDTVLASMLASGSVSYLFYADRLNQLPIGVVGVAVGITLLPLLSRQISQSRFKAAIESQNRALELAMFFTIPAAAALIVIPDLLLAVVFERGAFEASDTRATAAALAAYAVGLPAYVAVKVLAPGFFARKDVKTPVKIAALAVAVNIVLNLILMGPFAHVGLALATAVAAWVNAALLAVVLLRRGDFAFEARFAPRLLAMIAAASIMAAAVVFLGGQMTGAFWSGLGSRLAGLFGLITAGIMLYALITWRLGAFDIGELRQALKPRESDD